MENLIFPPFSPPSSPFDKLPSPFTYSNPFLTKFGLETLDFFDSQEEALTKDTNTPKEFTRFEENTSVVSLGLLDKKIQKLQKKPRKSKKQLLEEQANILSLPREKRAAKKPVHEYENTRIIEEERKKTRKVTKKQQQMRETATKVSATPMIPPPQTGLYRANQPEVSYKWRDWNLFFNHELKGLNQPEFLAFLRIVHDRQPECVSFEKGYAELKIVLPKGLEPEEQALQNKLPSMMEQSLVYQKFCGYIEEVKAMKLGTPQLF